ncbi:PREDICTED: kielin/chordin-like protein isoform X2 [Dinoponera quadriceps]|uniref:Kielin/chordin-like protein isoform X2 n=1 Tax=Dinoponera quadriceps TaxID=609295 RepID=A0A6P3X5Q3_DINQU|nr:PREDICTED: kielin/chordin-like protein isoform X2 [Dinoponera quadriceps]
MSRSGTYSFILRCAGLALIATIVAAEETCDETKCAGPLKYYKSLGCQPVYEKKGDCCAIRYNCDHLKERSKDKCYANGKAYDIDEHLKEEDANSCDFGCICTRGHDEFATFSCPTIDCYHGHVEPGCYLKYSPTKCCPELACQNPETKATCVVDGKTYLEGEPFEVANDPELTCVCLPGYTGENIAPFCAKRPRCDPYLRHVAYVQRCAPVYLSEQTPRTACNFLYRCPHENDEVIHTHESHEIPEEECHFGNLTLHHYDELNRSSKSTSMCTKCVCEVPPAITCVRLPADECNK